MNGRGVRVREYYAYALIAGISVTEARRMLPGFVLDCYNVRVKHDYRVNGFKIAKRTGLMG